MYCPEGKIVIEVISTESEFVKNPEILLSQTLEDVQIPPNVYMLSKRESKTMQDGEHRIIQTAEMAISENVSYDYDFPVFVAVAPLGTDKLYVAKGYLYNAEFALKFEDIFWTVIKSLEPFEP